MPISRPTTTWTRFGSGSNTICGISVGSAPCPTAEFRWVEEKDWAEAWKENFRPLLIGRRLRIQPAWLPSPPDNRLAVFVDPGMAFGTGTHPSTQFCLEHIEDNVRPGDLIADLGCGSGILSIAAVKLGADKSLAFDTDPTAVAVCQENALRNDVSQHIQAKLGSLDELKDELRGKTLPRLVVANIFLSVLTDMLRNGLHQAMADNGRLILSGVLGPQVDELLGETASVGLQTVDVRTRGEWSAVLLK